MARHKHDEADHCCDCTHGSAAVQTLDELDFERGIWAAAFNGEAERVGKILARGEDPDSVDSAGYTALHYASRNGQTEIVRILLEHRANPNSRTRSGGVTPLHRAAYSGHLDIVKLLLDAKAKPSVCDDDGKTPLHKGAERGHLEVCQLLVKADTSLVSLQDKRGRYPIDYVTTSDAVLGGLLQVT